ncbi:hypothetical protein ACFLZW_03265 [Chloroflexota bacterium]
MPILFTYCIPHDNGATLNQFWGVCILVICKPIIHNSSQNNDWSDL